MSARHASRLHPSFRFLCLLGLFALFSATPASVVARLRQPVLSFSQVGPAAAGIPEPSLSDGARDAEERAGAFYGAGRYEEALGAQRQAVDLHRRLVAMDPAQLPRLAASLHNLGVVLIRLGRKSEAIAPTEEALALYRSTATSDGAASQALERPLRNLVLLYFETDRLQAALPLADELVGLHRAMVPEKTTAEVERTDVLNLRASLLLALNRPREALRDLEAAVALARSLTRREPQNPGLQYGLAGSLVNLSQVADVLGEYERALSSAKDAEVILRHVAQVQPALMGDWAKSLSRLGQAHARVGQFALARPPLEESIALLRLLSRSGPPAGMTVEIGGYQDDLAHALESLATVLGSLNRPGEARAAGSEAMALYSALARLDPRYGQDVARTRALLTTLPQAIPLQR